ncbi:hypothetical protein EI42_03190 [Thermosporothrix hazakensis]|uniref:Uncharacterized protein n=1 Tax=Thermosporothrix hazakensis TaxID=644383 RepID=A0A326U990_THEHA|nr:hypothetical protein EI42_03190 [Thermosporothrix hazakensis]
MDQATLVPILLNIPLGKCTPFNRTVLLGLTRVAPPSSKRLRCTLFNGSGERPLNEKETAVHLLRNDCLQVEKSKIGEAFSHCSCYAETTVTHECFQTEDS